MAAEGRKISLADKTGGPVWSQANIREQSQFHDVSLISSDGESFPAHRVILAVSSSYLESKMKKNSQHDITFKKVNSEVLSALIDFIYDVIEEAEQPQPSGWNCHDKLLITSFPEGKRIF